MRKQLLSFGVTVVAFAWIQGAHAATDRNAILRKFDHDMHSTKVFSPNRIECSHCHNLEMDATDKKATAKSGLTQTTFAKPPREICHECHQSTAPAYRSAAQACFVCHSGASDMLSITPKSHSNISWRTSHSLDAKTNPEVCMKCHTTSQCTQCHLSKTDIELNRHTRNFKFFHSVEARMRPHTCDTCHTKTYCTSCHMGKQ